MRKQPTIHAADPGPWGRPKGSGGGPGGFSPGGSGRGPQKPSGDFDEWVENARRQLHALFGGEHNNRGLVAAFAVFFLLWLASGIYQLQPGEVGVIQRFGKFNRISTSGLRYHLPMPFESKDIVNAELIRMETLGGDPNSPPHGGSSGIGGDEILMLTGDENIINVSFNVRWKVRDAKQFVFNNPNPEETVREVTESAVREIIGRTTLDAALTVGKSKVAADATALAQETLNHYTAGIDVLEVNLLDAGFPQAVVADAHDVQAAHADQESARNSALGYTNDILPRARGKAERILQEAEGYKQQVVAQAQGQAARFISVYEQYRQAQDVTRKRMYLETMEKILEGTPKMILDNHAGATAYLPLPALSAPGKAAP